MRSVWILGDQLSPTHAALAAADPARDRVVMIESRARGGHYRYHQHKLVLVYAAMRHFAEELRSRGWRVDYHKLEDTPDFETGLRRHIAAHQITGLLAAEPNDHTSTQALPKLAARAGVPIELVPTAQFLLPRAEFQAWAVGRKRLLMEQHYRRMRERTGLLMEPDGTPVGGQWNYDAENRSGRREWTAAGSPTAPPAPVENDAVTREVMRLVALHFSNHPGDAATFRLPVTRSDSLNWLTHFVRHRLPRFGQFEDLMAEGEPALFHSVLTPMLNLGLLTPRECCDAAVSAFRDGRAPLAAVEGFVRQIIGWREFINGVYWLRMPGYTALNALGADRPLPAWFYTGDTEMNCLRQVLREVIATGYNHHIQRLMVLGNFMLLAGIRPGEAYRWFMEMYVDAHDWVMAANVIGMTLHADGGFMATKPYAAGPAYLDRMSTYCAKCRFNPKENEGPRACPFHALYWNFFDTHADRFAKNPRVAVMVKNWQKRPAAEQEKIRASAARFLDSLVTRNS